MKKKKKKKRKKKKKKGLDSAREDVIDDEPREAWTVKVAPSKECQVSSTQLDLEMDALREAWTLGQPYRAKSSFVSKLLVIGEYLINIDLTKLYFTSREKGGAPDSTLYLLRLLWCCCQFLF